ncbi:Putative white-brown complex homolog protein 30 [Seminavis robusta]|uniref:White-brown complex homolog protein 30 n=1 Tax=Seminavis robusta TaxID=568900 RepID=A0A9N8E205_9STRA|nr:Putative white-brown complex homolog protein 30 [Seminavis robusta]|eukprot:Sro537_g162420.1 Putative white-brown complex homolog protein 30 (668) ;mRNA; r:52104-54664
MQNFDDVDEVDVDALMEAMEAEAVSKKAPEPAVSKSVRSEEVPVAKAQAVGLYDSAKKSHEDDMPHTAGHHTADPFAPREGKTLVWRDVNMTLAAKGSDPDRKLLDTVWGEVPKKMTTAIMGPSGAGKTSLLNILAGRAQSHGKIKISSDIRLDNFVVDPTKIEVRRNIAFVAQDDSLQVTSTPRESIYFSAKLRLPKSTTEEQLRRLTNRMLDELGLADCADTVVGGALIKGISGGQRKRTSVGVELVTKPALVFLDEPTSGLDSFSAVQLCQVLKKVANAGASVLFTIHQPSSEIFNSFDSLILMNMGRVMYQGPTQSVPEYFGDRGHPNPPHYNPADWIMNVAQSVAIEQLDKDGFFPKDDRQVGDAFTEAVDGKDALGITITSRDAAQDEDDTPVGLDVQIGMLFSREMRNLRRDTMAVGARIGLTSFLSLLVGIIFLDVGEQDSSVNEYRQSQFGALVMVLMMSMFGTAQPALLAFPEERPVFLREYSTNHYGVLPYFMSRLTIELVLTALQILVQVLITYFMVGFQSNFLFFYLTVYALAMSSTALAVMLGCAVEDPKLGQEMLPLLFVPQMLFSGFFVVPDLIPVWLRWAQYLCSLTYAVRIAAVEEFNRDDCKECQHFLDVINADPDEVWWYWLVLVALFIAFRLFGLFILRQKAEKFY